MPNRPEFVRDNFAFTSECTGNQQWRALLRKEPCTYCGAPPVRTRVKRGWLDGQTLDHIHPRSAGGRNGWENRTPACVDCNRRKSSTPALLFLVKVGGYPIRRRT
jgi:5-methylcytosine-specific restriction endonuclease McrA